MNKQLFRFILFLLIYLILPLSATAQVVDIPDLNLRAAIEAALGKEAGAPITADEMATLTYFRRDNAGISDLSGLEFATNLTRLLLPRNSISDISPVAGLINLTQLHLPSNSISDISPVARLINLTYLNLWRNSISDISAVAGLTNLTGLFLQENSISDISPIAGLKELTQLVLHDNSISDISPVAALTNLTWLNLLRNSISDISPVAGLTNLTQLQLSGNSISDVSSVAGLINLTELWLSSNSISDVSPVAGLTNLTWLWLGYNTISDISALAGLTNLTWLQLEGNTISDISALAGLTNLASLQLEGSTISDISVLAGLTNLASLQLEGSTISDISVLAGLTNLTSLWLRGNNISDISALAGLTNLTSLWLGRNNISDISALAELTNLALLRLENNNISDVSSLIANTGLGEGDTVSVQSNPLSYPSLRTYIPVLQSRGVTVEFDTLIGYLLSIPAGISLIHVPLKVIAVDGMAKTITSIGDLYDALGGTSTVNFLITYDSQAQAWLSYFGTSDKAAAADKRLTDDTGIIASMKAQTSIRFSGKPLGIQGYSTITLHQGLNLVGLPLRDSSLTRVSDLFMRYGIKDNVPVIIVTDGREFKAVGQAGDSGDIEISGGQAFIMTAQRAATVGISGVGWSNISGTAAAPPVAIAGIEVGDVTPILALRGSIVYEGRGMNKIRFYVTVKNLSTKRTFATLIGNEDLSPRDKQNLTGVGYQLTIVDIETGRAAMIGDVLEVSIQFSDPLISVEPSLYTITTEDVKQGRIQLPALIAYEIPAETALLHNYPNPFNPETWIPYQLAHAADVTLTIYDTQGVLVRQLDLGYQQAGYYTNRTRAAYWDGRNHLGEAVGSGVYFYHLHAGDYSAIQKMVILK